MTTTRRITSLFLALCMIVSIAAIGIVPAAADTTYETYAQETIRGSVILHCFDWSYNSIKAALPDIAAAGYTAVQTSPVQRPKDYNASWTDASNQWWKLYQPLGFSVADNGTTWLGTKAELTSLCTEAEKYDIKVIVDIVANHVANSNTGGGYANVNPGVDSWLKNASYYHSSTNGSNDDSRYNITQYHIGMPDLNTGNATVQGKVLDLLEECLDCGVDGFRFDAAKHIELPTDDSSFASQFWPTVINGAKTYASSQGLDEPFFYGEILGSAGPNFSITNYTTYMAVTDNVTGDRALDKAYWTAASELADGTYYKGASADNSVLWVESHDTYMGNSGSAWQSNTQSVTSDVIIKAWAIVAARADSTALFFARPNSTMGAASTDTTWKCTEVAEVNKFKNHFDGQNEYLSSSGNTAYIERGTKGVVISKLDGGGSVSLTAHQMANGTYIDQVTGNTFTVSNGVISGTVGTSGVAVVYNADDDAISYITNDTLYLKPNSNWTQASARFAMYVQNSVTGSDAWVSMTSAGSGYYSAAVPSGSWTDVIFVRMNPSSSENRWDSYTGEGHVWDRTNDLFPDANTNCYTIASGAWSYGDGSWSVYSGSHTHAYGQPAWTWANDCSSATATFTCSCGDVQTVTDNAPTSSVNGNTTTYTATVTFGGSSYSDTHIVTGSGGGSNTYTIYAINNANWSKVSVYWWGSNTNCEWPGVEMTSFSGTKVYTYNIPNDVSGLLFTNGASSGTKQTVDITSGISDGKIWTINSTINNGKYTITVPPDYYLVGTMNSWTQTANYKFSIHAETGGKLEYKLSGIQLAANAEFKVNSSSGSWYPSGDNHTVSAAGTYDIYFRPNGDGSSDWLSDSGDSTKRYLYLNDVTPCTVTWKNGDTTLATDSVAKGSTPVYTGAEPTQASSEQYDYTFDGWTPDGGVTVYTAETLPAVTADVTYTAHFSATLRTFTVTWKNYDGTILETDENVAYGDRPVYGGETPTRPNDGATTYVFSFWSPLITSETVITADTTYIARFSTNTQTYTIRWFDGDGNLLRTESCVQGITPQYTGVTPTKTATAQYTYTFNNTWSPALVAADRDTDYTAQFDSTVNKYDITWKDGNGDILKTEEFEYGITPTYSGTEPTKYADADYTYAFNNTWSPAIVPVTGAASYTAQFDATPIPIWTVYATDVVEWTNVYLYYWTDFGDNAWPGVRMTPDDDSFIWSASIPSNARGVVFNNGASSGTKQTVNITSGIADGAHWAILNEKDATETSKYKIHAVPTYYLVGIGGEWGSTGAPVLTPHRASDKAEEYKLANVSLSATDYIKVYGSDDTWYPDDNYDVPVTGTYNVYFRPNGDGESTWYEDVLYLKNVTPYTITWKDGDGNTVKTDTVTYGNTPAYTGTTPTKTATAQYTYTFNGTWTPAVTSVTGDKTYYAQFTADVPYLDENGDQQTAQNVVVLSSGSTALAAGWYAVTEDTTISDRIAVNDNVQLILCDNATLTASEGIQVNSFGRSLTIYAQSTGEDMGTLLIEEIPTETAGIGAANGSFTINGGEITIDSMGSGIDAGSGDVTINGGVITVNSNSDSNSDSAIHAGNVTIDGASITVNATTQAFYSANDITIRNSNITAKANSAVISFRRALTIRDSVIDLSNFTNNRCTYGISSVNDTSSVTIENSILSAMPCQNAISIKGDITIIGGNVSAPGTNYGIRSENGNISLSWSTPTDSIHTNRYSAGGTVTLQKPFDNGMTVIPAGIVNDLSVINSKTLTPAMENEPGFASHSISLDGSIGVNFYVDIDARDPQYYSVTFTFGGVTTEPITLTASMYDSAQGAYKVPFKVNSPDMTRDITARLYQSGETDPVDESVFCVADYGTKLFKLDETLTEGDYYLIGSIGGTAYWGTDVQARWHFTENPGVDGEYVLRHVQFHAGDEFKVIAYHANGEHTGYPAEANYTVSADEAGTCTICFRPAGDGGGDWYCGTVYVQKEAADLSNLYELVRATLNYGTKAQVYFNKNTSDLANGGEYLDVDPVYTQATDAMLSNRIDTAATAFKTDETVIAQLNECGLTFYGASAVLESCTALRIYFYVNDAEKFDLVKNSVTFGGIDASPINATENGKYVYFEYENVEAVNLNNSYALVINGHEYHYSVMDYLRLARNKAETDGNENLMALVTALYWYNVYADTYFGED